jgi:cytochrome P450
MEDDVSGFIGSIDWMMLTYGGAIFASICSIGVLGVVLFTGIKLQSDRRDKLVELHAQSLIEQALRKFEHTASQIARSTAEQVAENTAAKIARREANLIAVRTFSKVLGKNMPPVPSDEAYEKTRQAELIAERIDVEKELVEKIGKAIKKDYEKKMEREGRDTNRE